MRTLSIASLLCALMLVGLVPHGSDATAAPPPAPPEFVPNQTATKPEPFPVKLVDQGKFDPRLKGISLPDGFKAEIVVDAPDTINPVGMTFDPDGNLYVLEWRPDPVTGDKWFEVKETFRYRDGTTRQVATMKKFTTDLIKFFKYDPKTGAFEKPKTIISEELPSSIIYHEGYLYVTGRGTVRRWKQSKPNGPWDVRETVAQGFCGFHHHQVSGLTIGNDGLLYLTSGDDDNFVEGSDGSRATVLRTGAVFRCRPDGSKMETYSIGYRNPYRDIAYDDKFNLFHTDNDQEDGSKFQGCRIMHVAEGSDFGWRLALGARCCRTDFVRGAVAGELPGKVPPMIKTGRGSPAGMLIYHDTRLPEQYRGLMYYPDVYRQVIRAYKFEPDGSTFKITNEFEFMKSEKGEPLKKDIPVKKDEPVKKVDVPNKPNDGGLFRPNQMVTGPDGAIYVCDWRTNSGGAGKLSGDGINGRIYRITWVGTKDAPAIARRGMDSWAKIIKQTDAELLKTLAAPDLTDRVEARKELVRRGPKARDLVLKKFVSGSLDGDARLVALGVLQANWSAEVEDLFRLLMNDDSGDVRRLAVDGLAYHAKPKDQRVYDSLLKAMGDRDPAVRRAAALGLGRLGADGTGETLVSALRQDAEADVYLKDAYVRAIERLGKPGIDALLALAQSGDKSCDLAVDVFLALRTRTAAQAIPEMMLHPHVTPEQREALVRSYTNYQLDPPVSLDPLADYLAKRPNEPTNVLFAAVDVFAASGDALAPKAAKLVLSLLASEDEMTRLSAIVAVESARIKDAAPKLIEFVGDPVRTQVERIAAVKALRVLGDKAAINPIKAVLNGKHPAVVKAEALRTLAALDIASARTAAEPLLDQPDPTLLAEAVAVLAATKPGAKLIGERFVAKKLPREFFPQVNDALTKFGDDPALAKLRADVLRGGLLLSLEPGQVDKIRVLVNNKGDAKKGKELYLNTKMLACATCHRLEGVGGAVGPDLSRMWDTHTVEKLLEAIVDPSKEIKEGFQTYRLVTLDSKVYTGLKVKDDTKEVIIRDANGRDIRVAKEDVESLGPSKISLMPDNVVSQITFDQFIDLLAFLKSKSEQESLRGLVVDSTVAGPFPSDVKGISLDTIGSAQWKPLVADASGQLDLKATFAVPNTPAVYVRAYVFAPKKQKATVAVASENPWRAWVNGATADPTASFEVELKQGWNVVLVKVANNGKPAALGVRVTGDGLRTAAAPDTLPPSGTGSR